MSSSSEGNLWMGEWEAKRIGVFDGILSIECEEVGYGFYDGNWTLVESPELTRMHKAEGPFVMLRCDSRGIDE
jgi:hypothetical protein